MSATPNFKETFLYRWFFKYFDKNNETLYHDLLVPAKFVNENWYYFIAPFVFIFFYNQIKITVGNELPNLFTVTVNKDPHFLIVIIVKFVLAIPFSLMTWIILVFALPYVVEFFFNTCPLRAILFELEKKAGVKKNKPNYFLDSILYKIFIKPFKRKQTNIK